MNVLLIKNALRTAFNLLLFTIVGTALLAFTYNLTRDTIARNEEKAKLKLIGQTLPSGSYDNNLLRDTLTLPPAPGLGTDQPSTVYRARWQGNPSAVVLEAIAPDGYGGKITMIIAIRSNGEISGVRVVAHNETPGLGDYIEIGKSAWIRIFDGASLANTPDKQWNVKKDGGKFDYMTGATITPRAMIKAVHHAVQYFNSNRKRLFATALPTGDKP